MENDTKLLEGFLFVDKPTGPTSFDVVRKIKHLVPKGTKVGHGGTLDPLASGLLIVGIGRGATKQFSKFLHADKVYIVSARLGERTDTYDTEGIILEVKDVSEIAEEEVKRIIRSFRGEQEQIPPMFSALKKDGKKLYDLARSGKVVVREPRAITISEISDISFNTPAINFTVHVSGGTYIRTLVHDIGMKLSVGAVMTGLRRIKVGDFNVAQAVELKNIDSFSAVEMNMINNLEKC